MIIEHLEVGVFAENCYIVGSSEENEGVVIDPGDESKRILQRIDSLGIAIKYVLLTHAHLDHVMAVQAIKEATSAPLLMHRDDQFLIENLQNQAAAFGLQTSAPPTVEHYIDEDDRIEFGDLTFKILHTPGHSPGSISFVTQGTAFVGDALFAGSIGRTDLPGGNYDILIQSIKEKLLRLEDDTQIFPGHGPSSTIGRERRSNPFLV